MKTFSLISRDELLDLAWNQGLTDAQIAQMYGVTANQVHAKRKMMNLVHGQVTASDMQRIVSLTERIRSLPLEAIDEIQSVVDRFSGDMA